MSRVIIGININVSFYLIRCNNMCKLDGIQRRENDCMQLMSHKFRYSHCLLDSARDLIAYFLAHLYIDIQD